MTAFVVKMRKGWFPLLIHPIDTNIYSTHSIRFHYISYIENDMEFQHHSDSTFSIFTIKQSQLIMIENSNAIYNTFSNNFIILINILCNEIDIYMESNTKHFILFIVIPPYPLTFNLLQLSNIITYGSFFLSSLISILKKKHCLILSLSI